MKAYQLFFAVLSSLSLGVSAQAGSLATYRATVTNQGPMCYFTFDGGNLGNAVATNPAALWKIGRMADPLATDDFQGGFGADIYRNPSNAVYYVDEYDALVWNGNGLIINGGGTATANSTAQGSVTFLFRALTDTNNTGRRYLFTAGGSINSTNPDGSTNFYNNAFQVFFENTNAANGSPNSLKVRFGNTTTPILQPSALVPGTWYYLAVTYTESSAVSNKVRWYLGCAGGTLASGVTTNASIDVAGDAVNFRIGNATNGNVAFRSPGSGYIDEFATWNRQLSAAEISNQFSQLPPLAPTNGTYAEVVAAQIPTHFFQLNNSLADSVAPPLSLTANTVTGGFTNDILNYPQACYYFAETNDALYITNDLINGGGSGPNAAANGTGTISFQFRMLDGTNFTGQRILFCQGEVALATRNRFQLYLENNNASTLDNRNCLRIGLGNSSWNLLTPQQLVPGAWYYYGMRWDETRTSSTDVEVVIYLAPIGGSLFTTNLNIANDSVVGDNGPIYIGNKAAAPLGTFSNAFRNPGEGVVDNIAFWNVELSPSEIMAQIAAMTNGTPYVPPSNPPVLTIGLYSPDVVISWPGTDVGYALEAATNLPASSWTSAGSPILVGGNYVVTNAITAGARFYRLKK